MLNTILIELGLTPKEVTLYEALLRLGSSSAAELAREVNLPRQTAYSILESLSTQGIIEQSDLRGTKQFVADLSILQTIVDNRKNIFEEKSKLLRQALPELLAQYGHVSDIPQVTYYQGREGLKKLLDDIIKVYKKGKHRIFRGYGLARPYPGMEETIMKWIEERHKLGVEALVFVPKDVDFRSIGGNENTYGRKFKILDIEDQGAGVYLVGNNVYLFSYKDNVGVKVKNQAIANLLKEIFTEHWKRVK